MAITKDSIFAAATDIAAAGGAATLAAVRKAVGGGSYTTISEALKEWRVIHQQATAPLQEPAPQALSDRLAGVINETWTIALEMANDRLNTERAALEQIRIDLEQSRREAVDLADQLSAELEQAQATIAQQAAREAATALDVERMSTGLSGALAGASEAFHTAQAALTEAHARAEQLAALLDREQAARAEAVERAAQAGQEAAVLAARLDDAGRRALEAEARSAKSEQQALATARELASANTAVQAGQARLESAAREIEDARAQAKEARADARKAGEEAAELRGRMAAAPKSNGEKDAT